MSNRNITATMNTENQRVPGGILSALQSLRNALIDCSIKYSLTTPAGNGNVRKFIYSEQFSHGKFYQSRVDASNQHEIAHDGSLFCFCNFCGGGSVIKHALTKFDVADTSEPRRNGALMSFPYLDAIGVHTPKRISELPDFKSPTPLLLKMLEAEDSVAVQTNAGVVEVESQVPDTALLFVQAAVKEAKSQTNSSSLDPSEQNEIAAHEPIRKYIFKYDSQQDYLPTERRELTATDELISVVKFQDWKFYADAAIWLPRRCIETIYRNPFNLLKFHHPASQTYELIDFTLGQSQNISFSLDYHEAGDLIVDRYTPAARAAPGRQIGYTFLGPRLPEYYNQQKHRRGGSPRIIAILER